MAIWGTQTFKYKSSTVLKGGELLSPGAAQGECIVATGPTSEILGVAAHASPAGNVTAQSLGVYLPGTVVKMIASAAISLNAKVVAAAGGQIVTGAAKSGTANATLSYYAGTALEAAANAGEWIAVLFWPTEVNL